MASAPGMLSSKILRGSERPPKMKSGTFTKKKVKAGLMPKTKSISTEKPATPLLARRLGMTNN